LKKILCSLIFLLIPLYASAITIVCDVPATKVNTYILYNNGNEVAKDIPAQADWSLRYDIQLDPGASSITAKACNERGCSNESVPLLLPALPGIPTNLKLNQ